MHFHSGSTQDPFCGKNCLWGWSFVHSGGSLIIWCPGGREHRGKNHKLHDAPSHRICLSCRQILRWRPQWIIRPLNYCQFIFFCDIEQARLVVCRRRVCKKANPWKLCYLLDPGKTHGETEKEEEMMVFAVWHWQKVSIYGISYDKFTPRSRQMPFKEELLIRIRGDTVVSHVKVSEIWLFRGWKTNCSDVMRRSFFTTHIAHLCLQRCPLSDWLMAAQKCISYKMNRSKRTTLNWSELNLTKKELNRN